MRTIRQFKNKNSQRIFMAYIHRVNGRMHRIKIAMSIAEIARAGLSQVPSSQSAFPHLMRAPSHRAQLPVILVRSRSSIFWAPDQVRRSRLDGGRANGILVVISNLGIFGKIFASLSNHSEDRPEGFLANATHTNVPSRT